MARRELREAESIRIWVDDPETARKLVELLSRRGMTGALVHTGHRWGVHVVDSFEREDSLLVDVLTAVELWLEGRTGPSSVSISVGGCRYLMERGG